MTTCSGKECRGAATGKARLPTVDSLTDGETKRLVTTYSKPIKHLIKTAVVITTFSN